MSIAEYKRNYYEENKDKIKEYYKQKVTCPTCGATYARSSASHHKKTQRHLNAEVNYKNKYKILLKKYMKLKYGGSKSSKD